VPSDSESESPLPAADRADPLLDGVGRKLNGHPAARPPASVDAALLQMQKLETLGRLTSEIAHDFSNLMTVVLGYGELLGALAPPDLPGRPYLDEMRQAAERASALTRQLLDFCRQSAGGPPGPVDVAAVVRTAGGMLAHLLHRSVDLRVDAPDGAGATVADPRQIEQVLVNLVLNARDAMSAGGRVDVAVTPAQLDAPLTNALGTAPAGEYVRLQVRDTGAGMDQATRDRLFQPFFTTKPKGTGLGLAIVARIVGQIGGAVTVESAPGGGTAFDVYFPKAA
jgi:two-component system, cell cycle sensor histidine kinase and response regulator CckA